MRAPGEAVLDLGSPPSSKTYPLFDAAIEDVILRAGFRSRIALKDSLIRLVQHGVIDRGKFFVLAYGRSAPKLLGGFIADLVVVLRGFSAMAAAYCASRVGRAAWTIFITDLEEKRAVSLSPQALWS
jgi:hypothetical protein